MASSGMLLHVSLVRNHVSEELRVSIIRVTKIVELGKLAVTKNRHTLRIITAKVPSSPILVILMMGEQRYSKTSVFTRAAQRNISDDAILERKIGRAYRQVA
jgi:hypothetical protein